MAAYETLRAAIDSYIKANGNKEITGTVLNDILNAMVSALGADTRFAGVAVPSTNPGNPEGNVVYFASQAGTYSNFGGIVLPLGIHILVWNGTAWTSQTWFSVNSTPTQNSQNLVTSGGIFQAIVDAVGVERLRAIGAEVTSCSFNSTTKKISFFNSANSTLFQLDATAFIIDGMVSDVKIEDGNLIIKFNTDAGKQDIEIPLTEIFDPANYYTKTAIDTLLTAINNKLADGCLYRGMAEPTTNPPTPTTKVFYIATKAGTYTNFGNIAVTEGITILKYDGSNWSKEQISYSDGVFDISAYNGTSYADLSAALGTNGANIPQNLRKGGMSVKFVQSSDNKYVQYRLMATSFSTIESDWQRNYDISTHNAEFLWSIVDSNNKVLIGIRKEGDIYWQNGVPSVVKEKISKYITDALSNYTNTTIAVLEDEINKLRVIYGSVVNNSAYLWAIVDSNNKILIGVRKEGDVIGNFTISESIKKYIKEYSETEILPQAKEIAQTLTDNAVENLIHNFPTVPYVGNGRMIISRPEELFCHAPRVVSFAAGNIPNAARVWVFYVTSPDPNKYTETMDNNDHIRILRFKPHNIRDRETCIYVSDLEPFSYNGYPVTYINNFGVYINQSDQRIHTIVPALVEHPEISEGYKINTFFHHSFSVYTSLSNVNFSPTPMMLSYTYEDGGNTISVNEEFTTPSFVRMTNRKYGAGLSENLSGRWGDGMEISFYNGNYYFLHSQSDGSRDSHNELNPYPLVLLKSADCITWEPVANFGNYRVNETAVQLTNGKVYGLVRQHHSTDGGVYYFTCDFNDTLNVASNVTPLLKVSSSESFPWIFVVRGNTNEDRNRVYGLYVQNSTYLSSINRGIMDLAELNDDGTVTRIERYTSLYNAYVYPSVSVYDTDRATLYFTCAEFGTPGGCDINFGILNPNFETE